MSSVHIAAIFNEVALLETLIDEGSCDINADDGRHGTPLIAAIRYSSPSAVELLVRRGANVDYVTPDNRFTALHYAVCDEDTKILELILPSVGNIDSQDVIGTTPLLRAVQVGNVEAARLLLEYGARIHVNDDMDFNPLYGSVFLRKLGLVKLLLEYGADPNISPGGLSSNTSILWLVMQQGDQENDSLETLAILEELIKAGINVNINDNGSTPLRYAIRHGAENTAKLLVAAGANVNVRCNNSGCTLIHDAVRARSSGILQTILEALKDQDRPGQFSTTDTITIDSVNVDGETPFYLAAMMGNTDAAEQLLRCGADIDKSNDDEESLSPLAVAILAGQEEMIVMLLKKGASTSELAGARFLFKDLNGNGRFKGMVIKVQDETTYEVLEGLQDEHGWQEREFSHNPTLQDLLEKRGILVKDTHISRPDLEPTEEVLSTLYKLLRRESIEMRTGTKPGALKWVGIPKEC